MFSAYNLNLNEKFTDTYTKLLFITVKKAVFMQWCPNSCFNGAKNNMVGLGRWGVQLGVVLLLFVMRRRRGFHLFKHKKKLEGILQCTLFENITTVFLCFFFLLKNSLFNSNPFVSALSAAFHFLFNSTSRCTRHFISSFRSFLFDETAFLHQLHCKELNLFFLLSRSFSLFQGMMQLFPVLLSKLLTALVSFITRFTRGALRSFKDAKMKNTVSYSK